MDGKQQAGFTLVELVVGMLLLLLIMGGVVGVLTTFLKQGVQGSDRVDRQQEARWAVDMIAQDVRYATDCYTSAGQSSSIVIKKYDSTQKNKLTIRYYLVADANNNHVLTREVTIPAMLTTEAQTVISPIGNVDRGFVAAEDFVIHVTLDSTGKKISQVNINYKIKKDTSDTSTPMTQTTVYPINAVPISS